MVAGGAAVTDGAPRLRTRGWWVDGYDVSAHVIALAGHTLCGHHMTGGSRRRKHWPPGDVPPCGICCALLAQPWMYSDEFAPPGEAEPGPAIGVEDLA